LVFANYEMFWVFFNTTWMKIQQLLYIDDDPDDYEIFTEVLKEILPGTIIHWLPTCMDLHMFLDNHAIDIIFTDMYLPKINGWDCLSIIRSHRQHQQTPVVFYTGSDLRDFTNMPKNKNTFFISKANTYGELRKLLQQFFTNETKKVS